MSLQFEKSSILLLNDSITRDWYEIVEKRASVCGYGEDCASALRGSGAGFMWNFERNR